MSRDVRLVLDDIVGSGRRVIAYVAGLDREAFEADERTVDAVVRNLEVMGEAAKNVPDAIRVQLPDVPWRAMAGMRDLLIHVYHGVDLDVVWDAASEKVPVVVRTLERWIARSECGE